MAFAYDPVGRLLEETSFDGSRTRYRYDRSSGVRDPATDAVRYTQEERFAYNGNGQMILAENPSSRLQ